MRKTIAFGIFILGCALAMTLWTNSDLPVALCLMGSVATIIGIDLLALRELGMAETFSGSATVFGILWAVAMLPDTAPPWSVQVLGPMVALAIWTLVVGALAKRLGAKAAA